ncbi:hypothetical protein EXU57_12185 [Segetibacter sp. 3557_3]|uniref:hypothetical protein n=1 Tax=Segetibacter sp. 3557_3 TaxID=2547429 RepID=UPI0010590CA2|nr:hypothetical protein [Segetibacter sp. 3557_3]TDH26240.1 hypothetical protein EXU57_12185 [Segetibacter sp. 3557_3]
MKEIDELSIPLTFEKQLNSNVNLTAWLFDQDGQLIQQSPVNENRAEFKGLNKRSPEKLRLLITPDVSDERLEVRSLKDLERRSPTSRC